MSLQWENYGDIAEALHESYPETGLINITNKEVIRMVNALPDFKDKQEPDDKELIDAVVYAWIGIETPPDEDITHSND
ncbi:MAG: Fe-S cluster assembly protein IscX [Alphaproteobacteria bacterium]|nr:Fe-S cluster assembly protein IscX [Alphaproteobacteria bacterium]